MSLWSIYWLFKLLRGKEGLGYGDFKLTAAIGAWLGWQALPTVVFSAAIGGLCVGLFLMVTKRMQAEQPLPFGPFLAGAGFIALTTDYTFWGWLL
jgi:leader peptidase (prepilin peptidase)/N-methyltransferase